MASFPCSPEEGLRERRPYIDTWAETHFPAELEFIAADAHRGWEGAEPRV